MADRKLVTSQLEERWPGIRDHKRQDLRWFSWYLDVLRFAYSLNYKGIHEHVQEKVGPIALPDWEAILQEIEHNNL